MMSRKSKKHFIVEAAQELRAKPRDSSPALKAKMDLLVKSLGYLILMKINNGSPMPVQE